MSKDSLSSATGAAHKERDVRRSFFVALFVCLVVSLILMAGDSVLRWDMVRKISAVSLTDVPPFSQRVAPGSREEHLILPGGSMDARWWVLHTEAMLKNGGWRIRETSLDNSPDGREIHWSSLLMWLLAVLARVLSWGSGEPPQEFVAEAALYAGPAMLILCLLGLGGIIVRRFGWVEAVFFSVVWLGCYPVVRTFQAGEADHHGIVVFFSVASLLCLVCGNLGAVPKAGKQRQGWLFPIGESREWFRLSGVLGAAALWVSAATAIPILVGAGIGACLSALATRRFKGGFESGLWKTWGVAGCLASLGFYALEYFPAHMGWRLEVNHPLYSFAWLGGGVFLQYLTSFLAGGKWPFRNSRDYFVAGCSLMVVALPVVVIVVFPQKVFWVADRFLLALHKEYIFEFQSLPTLIRAFGNNWGFLTYYPWPVFVLFSTVFLVWKQGLSAWGARSLLFLAPPVLIMQGLAVYQVRWSSASFALWALCALVLFAECLYRWKENGLCLWISRAAVGMAFLALLVTQIPQLFARIDEDHQCLKPPLQQEAGNGIILRDIAHRLIRSSPDRLPVVLTGPNSSTDLAYHGGIRTLGTLYWENMPGLKRTARIFTVPDEETALRELTAAGVTHIVVPSWDNFAEAYAKLLAAGDDGQARIPFFEAVLKDEICPDWLRPFAYPIPTASGLDANSVKIFAVIPRQNRFEAFFFRGIYYWESGNLDRAKSMFEKAGEIRPGDKRVGEYLRLIAEKSRGNFSEPGQ